MLAIIISEVKYTTIVNGEKKTLPVRYRFFPSILLGSLNILNTYIPDYCVLNVLLNK